MNKKIEDEKIISVLLTSDTRKDACKVLGIKTSTLYARMSNDEFRRKYQEAKDQLLEAVVDRLQAEMIEAVNVIAEIMKDKNNAPQVRLNASDALIRHGIKMTDQREILERIETLEAVYISA